MSPHRQLVTVAGIALVLAAIGAAVLIITTQPAPPTATPGALPPNTVNIYALVGVLGLAGAVFGALGQWVSGILQRGHEQHMQLDEVKRKTYIDYITLLNDVKTANLAVSNLSADPERILHESNATRGEIERNSSKIEYQRGRLRELSEQLSQYSSALQLIAPTAVRIAANHIAESLDHDAKNADLSAFIEACRNDLGALD